MDFGPKLRTVFSVVLLLNVAILILALISDIDSLSEENGILETAQTLLSAAALAIFAYAITISTGAMRVSSIALTIVMSVALFREIDFRIMPGPDWLPFLTNPRFRDTVVIGSVLVIFYYLYRNRQHAGVWIARLSDRSAIPIWIGGALLLASTVIDHNIRFAGVVLVEEVVEVNGFLFILFAAVTHTNICLQELPNRQQMKQPHGVD